MQQSVIGPGMGVFTRFAKVLPGGIIAFHGLTAFWLDGKWVRFDAALDQQLCLSRRYRLAEPFGPGGEALLPDTDLEGQPHFDFLGERGPFADLPVPVSQLLIDASPVWNELRQLTGATM